jgi:hypothetical protein
MVKNVEFVKSKAIRFGSMQYTSLIIKTYSYNYFIEMEYGILYVCNNFRNKLYAAVNLSLCLASFELDYFILFIVILTFFFYFTI